MIAALYVEKDGPYFNIENVDAWDKERDARMYNGPFPVVAHPPCKRYGRYWSGGPSTKIKRLKGDDNGCFDRALWAVRNFGGVIEHPAASYAFSYYGLGRPTQSHWVKSLDKVGSICQVAQGHYGHPAEKLTWLYVVGDYLPPLHWGRCINKKRLEEGFKNSGARKEARAKGIAPIKRISFREMVFTPSEFKEILIDIARKAK